MKKYVGKLDWLIEQGIDTAYPWILEEDGKIGYAGTHPIDAGDHLKIYGEDGAVIFDSAIMPDYQIGRAEHPMIKGLEVQFALGCWVCWIQKDWQPDAWAALFIRSDNNYLRGELTKKEGV
ncbi:MAG: hypothetical protein AAB568_00785 [Patescibacteria group bacterium]